MVIERFSVVAPGGMLAPTPHIVTPVSMLGHMLAPMRHVGSGQHASPYPPQIHGDAPQIQEIPMKFRDPTQIHEIQ